MAPLIEERIADATRLWELLGRKQGYATSND